MQIKRIFPLIFVLATLLVALIICLFGRDKTVEPTPTKAISNTPTISPTVAVSPTPTVSPTCAMRPTATPTSSPVPTSTPIATNSPTVAPTNTPIPTSTPVSTSAPTNTPMVTPTSTPTSSPTSVHTVTPTSAPTSTPTPTSFILKGEDLTTTPFPEPLYHPNGKIMAKTEEVAVLGEKIQSSYIYEYDEQGRIVIVTNGILDERSTEPIIIEYVYEYYDDGYKIVKSWNGVSYSEEGLIQYYDSRDRILKEEEYHKGIITSSYEYLYNNGILYSITHCYSDTKVIIYYDESGEVLRTETSPM